MYFEIVLFVSAPSPASVDGQTSSAVPAADSSGEKPAESGVTSASPMPPPAQTPEPTSNPATPQPPTPTSTTPVQSPGPAPMRTTPVQSPGPAPMPSPPAGFRPRMPATSDAFLRPMAPPAQQQRMNRPPVSSADPYATMPGTPRPRPMSDDPYATMPGTPRPAPTDGSPHTGMPPSSIPYSVARGMNRMSAPRVSSPGEQSPHFPGQESMRPPARLPADPYAMPPGTPRPAPQQQDPFGAPQQMMDPRGPRPQMGGDLRGMRPPMGADPRGMRPMMDSYGQRQPGPDSFPRPPYGMRPRMPEDPYATQPGNVINGVLFYFFL